MHVIFLNRYFYPDHSATSQMLSDLAFALAARKHRIAVITSRQLYGAPDARLPPHAAIRGVNVHRVWTTRFGRRTFAGRTADYLTFHVTAAAALWRLARTGTVVVAKTDPPMLSVIAALIARLRGARLVNWLQDIFPETAERLGAGGPLLRLPLRLLRIPRNRSLHRAAANVAVGERMAEMLVRTGLDESRIRVIPNWAGGGPAVPWPHAANALRTEWGLADRFVVGYSGNLGRAHEYETLLDAISRIEQAQHSQGADGGITTGGRPGCHDPPDPGNPHIVWLFTGGGALYEALAGETRRRGFSSVVFRPYQPRERLSESLSVADVHLVSLRRELEGLIVPSKFYGVAAVGRPAIFVGHPDGEIARLIRRYGCGRCVAGGDGAGLARTVLELAHDPALCRRLGLAARAAFLAHFSLSRAAGRWEKLLEEVARQPAAARKAR